MFLLARPALRECWISGLGHSGLGQHFAAEFRDPLFQRQDLLGFGARKPYSHAHAVDRVGNLRLGLERAHVLRKANDQRGACGERTGAVHVATAAAQIARASLNSRLGLWLNHFHRRCERVPRKLATLRQRGARRNAAAGIIFSDHDAPRFALACQLNPVSTQDMARRGPFADLGRCLKSVGYKYMKIVRKRVCLAGRLGVREEYSSWLLKGRIRRKSLGLPECVLLTSV